MGYRSTQNTNGFLGELRFVLAVILVVFIPVVASVNLQPSQWPCGFQVLLYGGLYLLLGMFFGFRWPADVKKLGIWMLVPIFLMFGYSILVTAFTMDLGVILKCDVYSMLAMVVSPIIGLILGRKLNFLRKG
jgi:hypothetical protein